MHSKDVEYYQQSYSYKQLAPSFFHGTNDKSSHLNSSDGVYYRKCTEDRMKYGQDKKNYHVNVINTLK